MMTTNDKIVESAYRALLGQLKVENSSGGWCLRVTRQIVQDALGINHDEFYHRFLTVKASGTDAVVPYARDVQVSLRGLGYQVSDVGVLPGDLFFSWKPMPYGHVGVVLSDGYVLENFAGSRAVARNRFLCVSKLDDVRKSMPLEFFRLP